MTESVRQKPAAVTGRIYVLTVFDTNRKRPTPAAGAEKGHKTRASEVLHFFDASFGKPFFCLIGL
jgi:hypothetical protein